MVEQFFIFGHYGWKNTGDDAMIYALLQEVHSFCPTATFAILSNSPIIVPPYVKDLVKFVKPLPLTVFLEIMRSRIFIMGGGTQIYDYGAKIKRIKIMSEMFVLLIWAKIFCKKIYLLGIGIEPFSTWWGKLLSKKICGLADFISVRDNTSYYILDSLNLDNKAVLSFDLAALLPYSFKDLNKSLAKGNDRRILGISILPFFEIYHNNKEKDRILVNEIAKGLNDWLNKNEHNFIHLFVFKGESRTNDVMITETLRNQLMPSERVKYIAYNPNPIEMMHEVAECHLFVGMRYHSCIFSYLTNTPLLIINYFKKCQALSEDIGLSEDAIMSIEDILNGNFGNYLERFQECPDKFIANLPIDISINMAKKALPQNW
jgi:polysaccharide pyruvyl transferase WcaK-like protein